MCGCLKWRLYILINFIKKFIYLIFILGFIITLYNHYLNKKKIYSNDIVPFYDVEKHLSLSSINKKKIILLHGYGGSPLTFSNIVDSLKLDYDIYNIYLKQNDDYKYYYSQQTICLMILKTMELHKIQSAYFMGHDFGAYISVIFESIYPNYVDGLILISPIGILPVTSKYGAYWGILFKYNLLKYVYLENSNSLMDISQYIEIDYDYNPNFGNLDNNNGIINFMFNCLPFNIYVLWNSSLFSYFYNLHLKQKKVLLIYGSHDTITPSHQGLELNKKFGFPFYVVNNTRHNPLKDGGEGEESEKISNMIVSLIQNDVYYEVTSIKLNLINFNKFKSSLNIYETDDTINVLYFKL